MLQYRAPIRDIQFALHELLNITPHYNAIPAYSEMSRELIDSVIEAGAKFAEEELSPLNRIGDEEGCRLEDGNVITPTGFKEAYAKYVALGNGSIAAPTEYGGQGLPLSLGIVLGEMNGTANWSWGMYPGLSHGATKTVEAHGTHDQKAIYLPKLISGEWTGTMCLTESHAGSDLGLIRTKAEPANDGTYRITGNKIFISAGDHDMAENIVHIVLARLPDAPKGTKGISLFIVPKFVPDSQGNIGDRNNVICTTVEHKMGIRASATCALSFDGATGYLIGPPNKGLHCMFTFMNEARIGTAVQGVCSAEGAFQGALKYAKERLAMRALSAPQAPEKEADPIIVHPAVRTMLLTQKAFSEGGRALVYWLAMQADIVQSSTDEEPRKRADEMMSLLTPIAKAFLTEMGSEAAKHGVQIYGGHGYIREWGMEQIVRDTRIACLYEGTTEIQSLDLLGRKVLQSKGQLLMDFTKIIHKFCQANEADTSMSEFVKPLSQHNKTWGDLTMRIAMRAMMNPDEVGVAAVDYTYFSGYVTMAYIWAWSAKVALDKLKLNPPDAAFYQAKVQTAQFYFKKILPRVHTHLELLETGADVVLQMDADAFAF
ncbi:MAG: acyl-CoA dehydrogenase C-terminal domain-containing protein [Gammaproteobacteria bacterium]|nr:acyl-CoA dehydrogenase C-terminal domain-containing protein [Gammaproteobacteria bacterium]